MAELLETYACVPSTERGRGILMAGDPKSDAIIYCNGRAVIIRRLGAPMDVSIYGEHAYQTTVARFSPNGEWIASADISGTVRIWGRYGDRALKNEFRVLSGRIDDLQWSPDGQRIVASGDGKGNRSFEHSFSGVVANTSCQEDFTLDSPCNNGGLSLDLMCLLLLHLQRAIVVVGALEISNSSGVLMSHKLFFEMSPSFDNGGALGYAFIIVENLLKLASWWDSGTNIGEFDGHSKRVLSCDFKPTRPFRIVTCGEDFILNFYEGPPFKFKHSHRDHSNFVNCVRFSPDGSKFITVSSDKKGIIFDGKSGDKIGELSMEEGHGGSIYAVSWSPNSKQVLTVSADKTAKVWDITDDGSGKLNRTLACPSSGGVDDMQVGCLWHGDHLVTVSLGGNICLCSANDPDKPPTSFSGHMKGINALSCFLHNGQRTMLTTSYDGVLVKWVPGVVYGRKIKRKENTQIKCFAAAERELLTSGFDNRVTAHVASSAFLEKATFLLASCL
ncbi:hypothetical protein HPP92_000152 [Vanilla planifolia]|uniref:Uncharacterized protein n=1 Tax=Vanilla planifolia TaxID=51239 RepID=A0A835VGC7_VANPL|nr:hypothetical protein HPP92_000152 [Vanilla planifolia]